MRVMDLIRMRPARLLRFVTQHVQDRSMKHAGHTIRTQREALGVSLRNLAERAGVSPSQLSRFERGLFEPTPRWKRDVEEAVAALLIEGRAA
jgi:ribosome-binding protein aMBF1 (putative translation factor)